MQDDLIRKVAGLMGEQSSAYNNLESATTQLSLVMARGETAMVEALSKAGEKELSRMRSRLLEITTALTEFAELRGRQTEKTPLDPQARDRFETSAKSLLEAAKSFQRVAGRASSLAHGGLSFANSCIQMCGLPPTTYRAPVLRYAEGAGR
jgi:methylphosphotriester-DNA--protein-cysteine methyltransferase